MARGGRCRGTNDGTGGRHDAVVGCGGGNSGGSVHRGKRWIRGPRRRRACTRRPQKGSEGGLPPLLATRVAVASTATLPTGRTRVAGHRGKSRHGHGRGRGVAHDRPAAVRRSRARVPYASRSRRARRGDRYEKEMQDTVHTKIRESMKWAGREGGSTRPGQRGEGGRDEEGAPWVPPPPRGRQGFGRGQAEGAGRRANPCPTLTHEEHCEDRDGRCRDWDERRVRPAGTVDSRTY